MITSLSDWFKVHGQLFQPIRSETKTKFYLDKSSKINSNCPKMGSMNDSAFSNQGKNGSVDLLVLLETKGKSKTKFRTKCSLKTCIVLSSSDKEGSPYCDHKKRKYSPMETGINRVS